MDIDKVQQAERRLSGATTGSQYMSKTVDKVTKLRHLAKATTWRIIASTTTACIALYFGLPPKAIGAVFAADMTIKFILYYGHERLWYKYIRFGLRE